MANVKGKSICVFSAKGGVGKTTTALNLAGIFAALEKKVLIIDFDIYSGDIATYLNVPADKSIYNLVDDYANNRYKDINDYIVRYDDKISILACPKDPRQAAKIDNAYVSLIIEKAVFKYDIVIIDTNHVINEFNINVLDECDTTLLVTSNDLLDMKSMRNLVAIFKDANKENYKILLNESISLYKKYYSLYDIKSVIKSNIDYKIPSTFFIKNIDKYIADGKIITLEKNMKRFFPKVYKAYMAVCDDVMEIDDGK